MNNFNVSSTCKSPYPSRSYLQSREKHVLIMLYTLLTPTNLLFNGFLVYGMIRTKQYVNVASRLILTLSISDLCIGLIVQPLVIVLFITQNCALSWLLAFTAYVFLNYSGLTIFVVSFDRFLRLRRSSYLKRVNVAATNLTIGLLSVASLVIATGMVVSSFYGLFSYFNIVVIIINVLAAGGILVFYTMAWRNVRKQLSTLTYTRAKSGSIYQNDETQVKVVTNSPRKVYDAVMTKTIAAILVCCCLTYPPYFIVSLLRSFILIALGAKHSSRSDLYTLSYFCSFFLMFLNSTVNAILYSCHNRALKNLFVLLFTKHVLKRSRVHIKTKNCEKSEN